MGVHDRFNPFLYYRCSISVAWKDPPRIFDDMRYIDIEPLSGLYSGKLIIK